MSKARALAKKNEKDLVPCCLCMHWIHPLCANEDVDKALRGAWCCPSCRALPDRVDLFLDEIRHLRDERSCMHQISSCICALQKTDQLLVHQLACETAQCDDLCNQNAGLRDKIKGPERHCGNHISDSPTTGNSR